MPLPRAHLTTVLGSFEAKVLVARLACEGVTTELRGYSDGPYPLLSEVQVFVAEQDLPLAREILLADAVDAAFSEGPRRRRRWSARRWPRAGR